MTIIQLETFLKIAETGNFTTTAGLLGYAQSTVTTQIKQLEEELGCLLFDRLGKTAVLTPEGRKLETYAEKMMQLQREILLEVPAAEETAGLIQLGVSESLCYHHMPQALLRFRRKYPAVEIRLSFIMHDTFPVQLKKGSLDIAYSLDPPMDHPELKLLSETPETLGFFAHPDHPLSKKTKITERDLADVPLLLTSHSCSFRHMLLEDLARSSVIPKIALETSSKEILKQFAVNQLGVAFMPDMAARKETDRSLLKKLDWAGNDFPICSRVYVHKDKRLGAPLGELATIIGQISREK